MLILSFHIYDATTRSQFYRHRCDTYVTSARHGVISSRIVYKVHATSKVQQREQPVIRFLFLFLSNYHAPPRTEQSARANKVKNSNHSAWLYQATKRATEQPMSQLSNQWANQSSNQSNHQTVNRQRQAAQSWATFQPHNVCIRKSVVW